jgi:hypothetical protein
VWVGVNAEYQYLVLQRPGWRPTVPPPFGLAATLVALLRSAVALLTPVRPSKDYVFVPSAKIK